MPAPKSMKKWVVAGLFAVGALLGGAAAVWLERAPLLTWYCMSGLERATDQDRALWADRVAGLGEAAEPAVLASLAGADDGVCRNAGAVLERWTGQWDGADGRAAGLAERMAKSFGDCSPKGRCVVLDSAAAWFRPDSVKPAGALLTSCARLVTEAAEVPEGETHAAALNLFSQALDHMEAAREMLASGRPLVRKALYDEPAAIRLSAVKASLHYAPDLLDDVAVLLKDPAPEVRRAALAAVGPADEKQVPAKSLLPVLHDSDPAVRKACEDVLRNNRRLSPLSFKIGWCLCHPDPAERLNVLDYLQRGADVEPGVWLRELSHDDSAAVRLAALRAMTQQDVVDLSDRLQQMAESDASPTVCQIARLYQKWTKTPVHDGER
ncbi:MAG TPA: hypothetical protein VMS17_06590 [Gemmataceae bacterium]|nr:hypothetical protein [Gemmataceae bacterium]